MLGDIHKLFGRDFLIAFFLPTLAYLVATLGASRKWDTLPQWLGMQFENVVQRTAFIAIVAAACSLLLMAFNRLLVRALEGYWPLLPRRYVNRFEAWRFRRLVATIAKLRVDREAARVDARVFPHRQRLSALSLRAAERFPHREDLLLPTSFGNTMRAFEDYPRVMYGFESIQGWRRLETVIPTSFKEALSGMRALVDFWVNVWFLSILFLLQNVGMRSASSLIADWPLLLVLVVPFLAAWRAALAAQQWGELVKASFDVFLPALADKLGYQRPASIVKERELWRAFSQAIVYRDPDALAELDAFRTNAKASAQSESVEDDAAKRH